MRYVTYMRAKRTSSQRQKMMQRQPLVPISQQIIAKDATPTEIVKDKIHQPVSNLAGDALQKESIRRTY